MSVILGSTGITFPDSTTQTTAATGSGTVTSVATGTGLTGGTITTSGTISLVTTAGAVGTYGFLSTGNSLGITVNNTYAGSSLKWSGVQAPSGGGYSGGSVGSGTWRSLGSTTLCTCASGLFATLFIRIA